MERSRITLLCVLVLLPLAGLEARLAQLQLAGTEEHVGDLVTRKRHVEVTPALRARILDVRGTVLAENRRAFDAWIVLEEHEKSPGPLATLLGLTPEEFRRRLDEIYTKIERQVHLRPANEHRRLYLRERRTPYLLARDVDFEVALAIETSPARYAGALIRESTKRHYPLAEAGLPPETGCHVIGFLGRAHARGAERDFQRMIESGYFTEGFEDLISEDGVARLVRQGVFHDAPVGRAAIERQYDPVLRGRPGLVVVEREPGTSIRNLTELKPAEAGEDVELTLDIRLQARVEQILREIEQQLGRPVVAAAVVLDARTGAIAALASNRLYNPADLRSIDDPQAKPLLSRAFADTFQLGSIFKIATAVAALEEGKVTPDAPFACNGKYIPTSQHFACWIWRKSQGAHGELRLPEALERSCNPFFYEMGRRCGMETVAKWARAMGCGAPTGLDLPGEAAGRVPDRAPRETDVYSLAIGQHDLMVTPLQAAVMIAVIANGGSRVTPHLRRRDPPPPHPLGLARTTVEAIQRGLHEVVNGAHGTAHNTRLKEFRVAGKTSSAQNRQGEESHAWFGGYAPFDHPEWVVVTLVEHGGAGGEAAAPAAARIFEALKGME